MNKSYTILRYKFTKVVTYSREGRDSPKKISTPLLVSINRNSKNSILRFLNHQYLNSSKKDRSLNKCQSPFSYLLTRHLLR